MKFKTFFIIFKGFLLNQIKQCFSQVRVRLQFEYPNETKLLRVVKQFN